MNSNDLKELMSITNEMDNIVNNHAVLHDGKGNLGSCELVGDGKSNEIIAKLWDRYNILKHKMNKILYK